VRGAVFEVYNILGPGLLESAYEAALTYEFVKLDMECKTQVPINFLYNCKIYDNYLELRNETPVSSN